MLVSVKGAWTKDLARLPDDRVPMLCSPMHADVAPTATLWVVGGSGLGRWLATREESIAATRVMIVCIRSTAEADYLAQLIACRLKGASTGHTQLLALPSPLLHFIDLRRLVCWQSAQLHPTLVHEVTRGNQSPNTGASAHAPWLMVTHAMLALGSAMLAWQVYVCIAVTGSCTQGVVLTPFFITWGARASACAAAGAALLVAFAFMHTAAWACRRCCDSSVSGLRRGEEPTQRPLSTHSERPMTVTHVNDDVEMGPRDDAAVVPPAEAQVLELTQRAQCIASVVRRSTVSLALAGLQNVNLCLPSPLAQAVRHVLSGLREMDTESTSTPLLVVPHTRRGDHVTFECNQLCGEW